MAFIQLVEFSTTRIDELRQMTDRLRDDANAAGAAAPHASICADRDTPNRYVVVVEFPSYEEAMENSNRPEVTAFAQEMAKLCDGPPTFRNLDVIDRMGPS